jgi:hypothetical protein
MYLMGVKPWESSKWVLPDLKQMTGKVRQRLEETNPELAIQNESIGDDMGTGEQQDEERMGNEDRIREKEKEHGLA